MSYGRLMGGAPCLGLLQCPHVILRLGRRGIPGAQPPLGQQDDQVEDVDGQLATPTTHAPPDDPVAGGSAGDSVEGKAGLGKAGSDRAG